ncbi:hypothetical protein ThrDRAFT_03204 [Frankia casuarinae]|nr:hypothetical protein CcI6DRAFT_04131 [Frankia sp. CcI6]EYT91185.1 hypothetical protein ThrDRAFT_03204 [Frankia casuarinae]KDA42312.1 hypothetical protein BMG523Draft_02829 [Frankia sp. BMG5.23]KEZ36352.1 hypothetical protein CEDDRAFT_02208 [Frankia sp. CeD]KFB05009.1 hypothetical protein ALLO2DRAFT_02301 [Frankia sp. Allo2]
MVEQIHPAPRWLFGLGRSGGGFVVDRGPIGVERDARHAAAMANGCVLTGWDVC